jgi:hypothetical protein
LNLSKEEKAFVIAAINIKNENDKKQADKMRKKK